MPYTLEVCVDSVASALAAKRGGADRLELCADLIGGGTTPSLAMVLQVKAETGLPVRALLRPRVGDFCYDRYELAQMAETAAALVQAGADGIVTGVLTQPDLYEKTVSNMVECKSRGAYLMGLTTFGNYNIEDTADFTVYIPKTDPHIATSLAVIPLQLLGYYVSVA